MSKFSKIMIALLAIAMVAGPAFAEDRLGLSGEMRVRGWYIDDANAITDSKGVDRGILGRLATPNSTETYADQRLRIGGKISIAEGVSVSFRTDITEHTWGSGGNEFGSGRMASTQQWDRAHLDLAMGSFSLRAGTQYVGLGLNQTVNSQDSGLSIKVNGPVTFSAFAMLDDQSDTTGNSAADSFLLGAGLGHKTDLYSGNFFAARQNEANDKGEEVYVVGADAVFTLDAVKIAAEANYFFGDASATMDAMGLQLFLDASMAASDMVTFGGQFFYAKAADSDGTEMQYQVLGNDFNGWDPINEVGTSLSNEQITYGRPFDFTGDNAGVIGGRLYANVKASDSVGLGFSVAYLTPEDDSVLITDVDSATALTAGLTYAVMANTSLHAQLQYLDVDAPGAEEVTSAGLGLFVKF